MNKPSRLIVVTGGASGIGEATARRFAQDGCRVVIGDLNADRGQGIAKELLDQGHAVSFERVDLSSEEDVLRFASAVTSAHGTPSALVNSGGILQNAVRLLDMDMRQFDALWQINVRGTLLAMRAFGAGMLEAGEGSVINLCSLTTYRPSAQIGYAVGKAALKMMTETMAAEWGPRGVRVNAVAPGYTLTPAMQARIDSGERDPAAIVDKSALRRFVSPAEVADAIYFLCSPQAASITGATLPVDAGWLVSSAYQAYASQPA